MEMHIWPNILLVSITIGISGYMPIQAADDGILNAQRQILQQKEQNIASRLGVEQSEERLRQVMTRTSSVAMGLEAFILPKEENSFLIKHFSLKAPAYGDRFQWINTYLSQFDGQRIGTEGINRLMKAINGEIMNRGYVTTRVYVEEQDLSTGKFYFTLLPGIVSDIRFRKETWGTWRNASAVRKGRILNIRAIEQTVDNFNSVPEQKADIKIEPGKNEGESVLVIDIEQGKPYKFFVTLDNSGTRDTGKAQLTGGLQLSNPFSINDTFYASWNEDATSSGEKKGTRANSIYYTVPFGADRLTFSYNRNHYHQTVAYAVNPFISSGKFSQTSLTWTHLLQRTQVSKTDMDIGFIHKTRHSYIDGTEIGVQRQKTMAVEIGVNHRRYFGDSVIDARLAYRRGLPWLADPGPTDGLPGEATTRYNMYMGNINLTTPITRSDIYKAEYNMNLRFQKSNQPVYSSEFLSIGGWYSVRGFDGEQTLSAEDGVIMRNEIRFPFKTQPHQIYLALDYGKVSGPGTKYLLGKELFGGAIGMRGHLGRFSYDAFIGWPLYKPAGFTTASRTYGFTLTAEI